MTDLPSYPGLRPGATHCCVADDSAVLENAAIRCEWRPGAGKVEALTIENRHTGQVLRVARALPIVVLGDGRIVDLASLAPVKAVEQDGSGIVAQCMDDESGLSLQWSAELGDESNAVVQSLRLTASTDTTVRELALLDAPAEGARQVGEVAGSVVVCGDIFLGIEHPLARNGVDAGERVCCALPLRTTLAAGESRTHTAVVGVVPPGQLRRGFLYYLEQRRIHPYRQFLHYNNWYDVVLARATERMTEAEALDAIEYFGQELVEKRGVRLDAFAWDDGWDDFNTLWDFHKGFPDGFRNLINAAAKYGASQGVWMSPNGGYATAKAKRLAYGRPLGYETNDNGYAMGGANYRKAFRDMCLRMMREHGVVFFKFDGMGEGGTGKGTTDGATGVLSDDIHAVLELSRDLHRENPDVYISATCGTWASPFWLLYADSVWRQGGDSGHYGEGDTRQQWITYRDMFCYERVVRAGPLYPLNSLMLHGILIGNRPGRAPAGMAFDDASVADEIWSFFGSGTCLQELYVSPDVPTTRMLDELAAAAGWARANADTLIDTHWVGGNPGEGDVYGWASWQPGKGILVLRNPLSRAQSFAFTPRDVLELPAGTAGSTVMRPVYPRDRAVPGNAFAVGSTCSLELDPFEVLVVELAAIA